jgi:single-strand DNA-binding protein
MSINKVFISGNLTRDPELRATQGGTEVLTFGMAVNDRRKNPQTGEWEDCPNWVSCVIFGKRAVSLSKILHRGMKVSVEGKLRYQQWQDKNSGQKRSKLSVVVDEIEFMSQSKAENGQQTQQPNNYTEQYQNATNSGAQGPTTYPQDLYAEEEIPF